MVFIAMDGRALNLILLPRFGLRIGVAGWSFSFHSLFTFNMELIFLITWVRFKTWGSQDPHRTAEDLAFAVARFYQLGGAVQNYYMVRTCKSIWSSYRFSANDNNLLLSDDDSIMVVLILERQLEVHISLPRMIMMHRWTNMVWEFLFFFFTREFISI